MKQERSDDVCEQRGAGDADGRAAHDQSHGVPQHGPPDLRWLSTERNPNADLAGPLRDDIAHDAIHAGRCDDKRQRAEDADDERVECARADQRCERVAQGCRFRHDDVEMPFVNGALHGVG